MRAAGGSVVSQFDCGNYFGLEIPRDEALFIGAPSKRPIGEEMPLYLRLSLSRSSSESLGGEFHIRRFNFLARFSFRTSFLSFHAI
jgi:hypothetical protein